jgi:hypothetical protein
MRGQGAQFDRVEVRWDAIEPGPDVWKFDQLDGIVDDAQRWDMSILAVVDGAPAWAVDRPDRVGPGPPIGLDASPYLASGEPNAANPWARFLATVAKRYRGRITDWEIWNEPNFRDSWHGTPDDYARLYTTGRTVLRKEAPGSTVLVGGLVVDDGAFLRGVFSRLCPKNDCDTQSVDGVAWHIYGKPSDVARVTNLTHGIADPFGLNPPIWVTEANVVTADPLGPSDAYEGPESVNLDRQAAFVIQLDTLARAIGVKAVAMYRAVDVWENGRYWGLFRRNWSPKPALASYRTAVRWLSHAEYVATTRPVPDVTVTQFARYGEDIYVIWADGPTQRTLKLPTHAASATVVSPDGQEQSVSAANGFLSVGPPPGIPNTRATALLASPIIVVTAKDDAINR